MKLEQILKEVFNISREEMKDESKFMDYGEWDSMTHMFFVTRLEDAYSMELTGDEIADIETVGDVKRIIISKGIEI